MDKEKLLNRLSESNNKTELREIILELEKYQDDTVVEAIIDTILKFRAKQVLSAGLDVLMTFQKTKKSIAENAVKLIFTDSPKLIHAGIDLLSFCGEIALPIVEKKILRHENYNIRKYGLDILKEIKTERSVELLQILMNDPNPNVKYSAIEFLMNFSVFKEKVIDVIRKILENEEFSSLYGTTTIASTIIYGHFIDNSFIPILREKLNHIEDDLIKHWIYKILIYLGDKEIVKEAKINAKKVGMEKVIEKDIALSSKTFGG